MSLEVLLPLGWSPPVGYANGIAVPTGRIVFVAGPVSYTHLTLPTTPYV